MLKLRLIYDSKENYVTHVCLNDVLDLFCGDGFFEPSNNLVISSFDNYATMKNYSLIDRKYVDLIL